MHPLLPHNLLTPPHLRLAAATGLCCILICVFPDKLCTDTYADSCGSCSQHSSMEQLHVRCFQPAATTCHQPLHVHPSHAANAAPHLPCITNPQLKGTEQQRGCTAEGVQPTDHAAAAGRLTAHPTTSDDTTSNQRADSDSKSNPTITTVIATWAFAALRSGKAPGSHTRDKGYTTSTETCRVVQRWHIGTVMMQQPERALHPCRQKQRPALQFVEYLLVLTARRQDKCWQSHYRTNRHAQTARLMRIRLSVGPSARLQLVSHCLADQRQHTLQGRAKLLWTTHRSCALAALELFFASQLRPR